LEKAYIGKEGKEGGKRFSIADGIHPNPEGGGAKKRGGEPLMQSKFRIVGGNLQA